MKPHPIQPLEEDANGRLRFKENAIVRTLLDFASPKGMDMNAIAVLPFTREDREQFAQLIGYSYDGASELSYVSSEVLDAAHTAWELGVSTERAHADVLRAHLNNLLEHLHPLAATAFRVHPSDLVPEMGDMPKEETTP